MLSGLFNLVESYEEVSLIPITDDPVSNTLPLNEGIQLLLSDWDVFVEEHPYELAGILVCITLLVLLIPRVYAQYKQYTLEESKNKESDNVI